MEEWLQEQCQAQADKIRSKLYGATLFGHPIDTTNADMMIVAAYWLAMDECSRRNISAIELAESIRF